ncbi:MAG TPA: DUF222 domain-containing protein [Acidimicrobiales bacterium]|nr:DUF222 domain-containing protein [Acidimicrobiales bacterium]
MDDPSSADHPPLDDHPPPAGHPPAEVEQLLTEAEEVLRRLEAAAVDTLDDDSLTSHIKTLQRLRCRLEATEAHTLAAWDGRRCWQPSGARSAPAWLAWQLRLPIAEARRRVRHARVCRQYGAIAEAWAEGEIDRTHVSGLLAVRNTRTADAFDDDHVDLLDLARSCTFVEFKGRCRMWELMVDPDGAEQGAAADRSSRAVHLSRTFGGMWFGKITLDPVSGEIVAGTLRSIEHELFRRDRAAAKERLGRDPQADELGRTPAQRRADALVEMAVRARTAPADGRRPAPLFSVVVGLETFRGPILELFNRTVLTPGSAAAWLSEADVERIVFDGPSRVIDVGARRRFFTGGLRRAIEVRDRTCYHPSCDEPPEQPEIDHVQEASRGGPTTQDNGRLACGFHNRWRSTHPEAADPENPAADSPDQPDGPNSPGQPDGPDGAGGAEEHAGANLGLAGPGVSGTARTGTGDNSPPLDGAGSGCRQGEGGSGGNDGSIGDDRSDRDDGSDGRGGSGEPSPTTGGDESDRDDGSDGRGGSGEPSPTTGDDGSDRDDRSDGRGGSGEPSPTTGGDESDRDDGSDDGEPEPPD